MFCQGMENKIYNHEVTSINPNSKRFLADLSICLFARLECINSSLFLISNFIFKFQYGEEFNGYEINWHDCDNCNVGGFDAAVGQLPQQASTTMIIMFKGI
jgi:hypothetical protein